MRETESQHQHQCLHEVLYTCAILLLHVMTMIMDKSLQEPVLLTLASSNYPLLVNHQGPFL